MKRYLLFQYPVNYPSGGMSDFKHQHDDLDELKSLIDEEYYYQIFDTKKGYVIETDDYTTENEPMFLNCVY